MCMYVVFFIGVGTGVGVGGGGGDRGVLAPPPPPTPILGNMYIKYAEFILDTLFGPPPPPQSCLRSYAYVIFTCFILLLPPTPHSPSSISLCLLTSIPLFNRRKLKIRKGNNQRYVGTHVVWCTVVWYRSGDVMR